jgi:transcriptional regulator with GAF, ATPase, and Fis domain
MPMDLTKGTYGGGAAVCEVDERDECPAVEGQPANSVRFIPRGGTTRPAVRFGHHVERYGLVGRSRAIAEVIQRIDLVAATRSTVLITGETGTGKELVARAIHDRSAQRHQPFIRVNCAAIPDTLLESELFGHVKGAFTDATSGKRGKFSLAHRGSIFLDEIGTMSVGLQAKLLRVLQEREIEPLGGERTEQVDVRVIAATNRDLRQQIKDGRFLEDLFYRLDVVPIAMPPLRERLDDVPMLVAHFVDKHGAATPPTFDPRAAEILQPLQAHHWPGNVRELENTIERAIVLATVPTVPPDAAIDHTTGGNWSGGVPSLRLRENVEWIESETVKRALQVSTSKNEAARLMGISPRALSYYLAKYPFIEDQGQRPNRTND